MMPSERIPFHVELSRIIELLARQIYQSPLALLRENCQNAYDAVLQRRHLGQSFDPEIEVTITPTEVRVQDNGIGMTKDELIKHYWRAGSSGKNNPEARAAGVVGTFGIGAMANFGIASELTVITESATTAERTIAHAVRETLSTTEDCIEIKQEKPTGKPGTTVVARIPESTHVDVDAASAYIRDFVCFLRPPVRVNGHLVSQVDPESAIPRPRADWSGGGHGVALGSLFKADVDLVVLASGEIWVSLRNLKYADTKISGLVILKQNTFQVRTFRSLFALATAAVSSVYNLGGIVDLAILEPTAGREALTTTSLQLLQALMTELERYVSEKIGLTNMANSNLGFIEWVARNRRFDLCSKLSVRMEPENRSVLLEEIRSRSKIKPFNVFEGLDEAIIDQYASDEQPLIVLAPRHPRRTCEVAYLDQYCATRRITDTPSILSRKPEADWSLSESAFALRMITILESDYFVSSRVGFGKISHQLPVYIDPAMRPIEIVLDSDSASVSTMLQLYQSDVYAMTGVVKDFVRNAIFPRIAHLVPSSTRQGAEAFLKAIRRPKEVFEYEKADLGSLSEIWQEYLEGKLTLTEAAFQSTQLVRSTVQVVDRASVTPVSQVLPDVLENERIVTEASLRTGGDELGPLPAITRLDKESLVKLLTIDDSETPLKGYRCFIALSERARQENGEFFLQPHRTEIVWSGQKALYVFQHHSGEFGLYYELQGVDILSEQPGGRAFPTATIVLKNQIYIPVPDEIREKFIPTSAAKKRFEVRCELLYPQGREEMVPT